MEGGQLGGAGVVGGGHPVARRDGGGGDQRGGHAEGDELGGVAAHTGETLPHGDHLLAGSTTDRPVRW
ncbi:hypothetical protein GCM10027194_06020 [Thalassiella azotivora]